MVLPQPCAEEASASSALLSPTDGSSSSPDYNDQPTRTLSVRMHWNKHECFSETPTRKLPLKRSNR